MHQIYHAVTHPSRVGRTFAVPDRSGMDERTRETAQHHRSHVVV